MKQGALVPCMLLAIAVAIASVPTVAAIPPFGLSITPGPTVSLGTTMTFALTVTGGFRNTAYGVTFQTVKPNGTGSATTTRTVTTDNRGNGAVSVLYPDPSWTPTSGTVATDVGGVYNVYVNQTSPTNIGTVQNGQFTVNSQLTILVSQPIAGGTVQRGQTVTISASVSSLSGPDTAAVVSANTPSNGRIILPQTGLGIYTYAYQVLISDPIGPWTIIVQATDNQGNSGSGSPVTVTIAKNDLIVSRLTTYNSMEAPTTSFSPGDTIFAFFKVQYTGGAYLTSGQFPVEIQNPSGRIVANLTAAYNTALDGFYVSSGYPVSAFDPSGAWTVVINANSLNDGYGNTGPDLKASVPFQIAVSPLSYWPFVVAGIVAMTGAIATFKRLDMRMEDFRHLEQVMGGPVPRGTNLLLLGDAGSGKTILSYQLLHEELDSGKLCALLSYDAFPEDVQERMKDFGWDIVSPLRKGRLRIIDCYSSLAGQGEGAIKDPSDLTELNIQVTAFIGKAKGGPVTVLLDSLTPIFNGVEEKTAINFVQTLGAKVKKTGGLFVATASKGAISDDAVAKLRAMADGVIELSITRSRGRVHRFLSVVKMERRRISPTSVPFEIDRSRGLMFRVSRFSLLRKRITGFLKMHHNVRNGGSLFKHSENTTTKGTPAERR